MKTKWWKAGLGLMVASVCLAAYWIEQELDELFDEIFTEEDE